MSEPKTIDEAICRAKSYGTPTYLFLVAEIERMLSEKKYSKAWFAEVLARAEKAEAEVERLKERLGPLGLEVLMIGEAWHYVNSKVKAEFERLKAELHVKED